MNANKEIFGEKTDIFDNSKKILPYVYEIIEKAKGKTVYYYWYKMNENEREEFIRKLMLTIKKLHSKDYYSILNDIMLLIRFKHNNLKERIVKISVIAYMIDKKWFEIKEIRCPNTKDDTSYETTKNNHIIKFVSKMSRESIYNDLFKRLGK